MPATQVRFKVAWQHYRVGDVINPPAVLREWLLARGYAVPHGEDPAPAEPKAPAKPKEKARDPHAEQQVRKRPRRRGDPR